MWTAALIAAQMASAGPIDSKCKDTLQAQVRYQFHLFNIMNAQVTRTPQGGPYKPYVILSCEGTGCTLAPPPPPILKYEPDHPDADENGMVAYPNMDLASEMDELLMAAAELEIEAKLRYCGATLDTTDQTRVINYGQMSPFTKRILIHLGRGGTPRATTIVSFDGSIASYRIPLLESAAPSPAD